MRLEPRLFWALSLPEWRALTRPAARTKPLARAELETLMKEHPDG
jgi:Phage tail assembly chaperone protein, TAC